jgi:DNA mismatch repair protein MutS2
LTNEVKAAEEVLRHNELWLGWIDCVHAKVRLSVLLQAREPILNDGDSIRLLQASHPILALQEKAQLSSGLPAPLAELVSGSDLLETNTANKVGVVPIDLVLSEEQKTLIISGANTGGKTVSLKTLGLLGAMVQAGLHIPVAEGSEWPVLSDIFAEIGDEQDVLAHLSTFSARVQTLVKMLAQVDRKSLVLLDEIGTGTDPAEGTALALAVLDELRQQEPFIVVTTHYHLIKAYGMLQQTVENVSVAFDEESGRPTYTLQYGHAGTSNALQIAADLGMPPEIIEAAKNHLDRDEGQTIDLIRQLGQAWQRANSEAEELRRQREQWELAWADLAREHGELVQSREAILTEVRQQTEELLSETEKELKSAISSFQKGGMREVMGAREKVHRIREDLDSSLKSQVQHTGELVTAAAVGKPVKLRGTDGSGTLLRLKDQGRRAEVQIGPKLVEVGTEALELLPVQHKRNDKGVHLDGIRLIRDEPDTYQQRLNLVGLRVEEALPLLDKAIDRAILEGCNQIHVVHGSGTGRLRQAVQNFLAEHAVVKGFRPEEQSQGGTGVTVVELKD